MAIMYFVCVCVWHVAIREIESRLIGLKYEVTLSKIECLLCLVVSSIKLSQLQTVEIATKIVYKGHFDEIENDVTLKMEYYSTQYLLGVSNKHKSILIVISVKLCGPGRQVIV